MPDPHSNPLDAPVFAVGAEYTRTEIHERLGGSKIACLPTNEGIVVAACLTRAFNPDAPAVMLCGRGKRTTPLSELFTLQREPIPVFVKQGPSRWAYHGIFAVDECLTAGTRFEQFIARSSRTVASVSYVVLLKPV